MPFKLNSPYPPLGDQPQAIERLLKNIRAGAQHSTLLGVTGSGKTFTMANVVAALDRPKRSPRSSTASSSNFFPRTRSSISSPISTTTSPRPTSPAATPTSRRIPA